MVSMVNFTKTLTLLVSLNLFASCHAYRVLSFDDVRAEGGFGSVSLCNVERITPSNTPLNDQEKEALVSSPHLSKLRVLDLQNQNLDDNFIEQLCNNSSLVRLSQINLSGNVGITDKSLTSIVNSRLLGSDNDRIWIAPSKPVEVDDDPLLQLLMRAAGISSSSELPQARYDLNTPQFHHMQNTIHININGTRITLNAGHQSLQDHGNYLRGVKIDTI